MKFVKLDSVCRYRTETTEAARPNVENYVSTESMLPDRGGIRTPTSIPQTGKIKIFRKGDVLISNIRPYFKKIWQADRNGTCSNDVLVFEATSCNPDYLFWSLMDDAFFSYVTKTSKGTKMPRGDKNSIMQYEISLPAKSSQEAVCSILGAIQSKININQKLNGYFAPRKQPSKRLFLQT